MSTRQTCYKSSRCVLFYSSFVCMSAYANVYWWGWVFFERTRILSEIQFTTYFIEIFAMETKRLVGSFVNVILTRQTCNQRSSRAAECKRWALGNDFSVRICYMFLISKFKHRDLGLPTSSFPSSQICSAMAKSDFSCVETLFFPGFCHCAADLATQVPKLCTDLNLGFLYISILRT